MDRISRQIFLRLKCHDDRILLFKLIIQILTYLVSISMYMCSRQEQMLLHSYTMLYTKLYVICKFCIKLFVLIYKYDACFAYYNLYVTIQCANIIIHMQHWEDNCCKVLLISRKHSNEIYVYISLKSDQIIKGTTIQIIFHRILFTRFSRNTMHTPFRMINKCNIYCR